jgi:mRNA-degrading endonuclease RelE of RelBE toxin-antitoxin system
MEYDIVLAPEAVEDLRILEAMCEPPFGRRLKFICDMSRQRQAEVALKGLRGVRGPQYRLRASDIRVF